MIGVVEHIHIAGKAGGPMEGRHQVDADAGVGLVGDRYAARAGHWQDDRVDRDITLVEGEVVDDLRTRDGIGLAPGETRRNLTTRGLALDALVDRHFWIGEALARGTRLCEPCQHLVDLTGKPVLRPLVHRGGLRAVLQTDGQIRVGDRIDVTDEQRGVGVLVFRDDLVLLGRRQSRRGHGTWSFPGGKPNAGESAEDCALRELLEETGLSGFTPRVIAQTVAGVPDTREVFRTDFVRVDVPHGDPASLEPDKTTEWAWRSWQDLPSPLFAPVAALVSSGYRPSSVSSTTP